MAALFLPRRPALLGGTGRTGKRSFTGADVERFQPTHETNVETNHFAVSRTRLDPLGDVLRAAMPYSTHGSTRTRPNK